MNKREKDNLKHTFRISFTSRPFGYPRYADLVYQRKLAASVYVDMVETAIIDEVCSFDWGIVSEDNDGNEIPGKEKEVETVESFFENPNTNPGESWNMITRMMLADLLEINSGILVKTFNAFGQMVEIVSRDGMAFTKNPDVFGMFTNRADLILVKDIVSQEQADGMQSVFPLTTGYIVEGRAAEEAAYFQYGFNTASRPVPFGKREIVWIEKKVRTDSLYGRSTMEVLAKTVQTLIYAVEHNLEYFSDNSIPPGVLGLDGMSTTDLKAFGQQWIESQKKKDEFGLWKKVFHKLTIVNKLPKFERLGYTNQELELIESQKWWAKMVWSAFGMTATELGFTEDAKGGANQIVQTSAVRRKIIYPILHLLEYYYNTQIVPEFGFEGIKFKYKIQDIDEETKKWGLYKLQTEAGLKSINEVRTSEGLDDVEWGDQAPNQWNANSGMNINMTDPQQSRINSMNQDSQNQRDQMSGKKEENKALDTDTPLTLQPNEELDQNDLGKAIIALLKKNEEKVIAILESQIKKEPLVNIKGIDDIPKMVQDIFSAFTVKTISDAVIQSEFISGWDHSEKNINQNVQLNEGALEFLKNHTVDNIKGMTEEIANDLKAELQRGIINGEGITKLKERVSKVFDAGENRAEMIARTETNRAENNGKLLAMKGSGLDMEKKWITHKDDRTSPICQRLDGQTVGLNDYFKDSVSGWEGQSSPSHVNCRSTMIFIDKEETKQKAKKEREVELGKQEDKENKLLDEEIKINLDEKEVDLKLRKNNLLKRLNGDLDGRDSDL